jgi:hypothetical protein
MDGALDADSAANTLTTRVWWKPGGSAGRSFAALVADGRRRRSLPNFTRGDAK